MGFFFSDHDTYSANYSFVNLIGKMEVSEMPAIVIETGKPQGVLLQG